MIDIRYVRMNGDYSIVSSPGWGCKTYEHVEPAAVPLAVRDIAEKLEGGIVEIMYSKRSRTAKLVPFYEQLVTW
jgi:hypothetical protein